MFLSMRNRSPYRSFAICFAIYLLFCQSARADVTATVKDGYIQITDQQGTTEWVRDDRKPSLYTGNFGDCMGDSVIDVTRFDASYYRDNMTVMFHLLGNTALVNESVMMFIGVYAYGESRFNLTVDPCSANIASLCPMNSSVPIEASGIIPISESQAADFPSIALSIPDFEGQAILRLFSNSTESQIACYSAVLTNGATFSQPKAVASVLGLFAAVSVISSFAVTTHGSSVSETRTHYAHSISVFVVFAVFHHIFFTGALSMNWPSVLVAFWSNYAWSAGMIYWNGMQNTIDDFVGLDDGNISIVGATASGSDTSSSFGGGYSISSIYRRSLANSMVSSHPTSNNQLLPRMMGELLTRRDGSDGVENRSTGYTWYGHAVRPGLPIPGNYSGFAGTLGEEGVAVSDAFMTGLLWFLILIAGVVWAIVVIKYTLEMFCRIRLIKTERLNYFRQHWLLFMGTAILRCLFIAFFMFMLLTMFQFNFGGSAGVIAIAALVFSFFLLSMFGLVGFALYDQYRAGRFSLRNRARVKRKNTSGFLPWRTATKENPATGNEETKDESSSKRESQITENEVSIHDDERFIRRFGWLSSRYRQSRWWFPATWLFYELVRACFYGGAAAHPFVQVFGLLAVECIALIFIVWARPFESTRLNLIMVYLLSFSKVLTVALSSAFEVRFNQGRIVCTVIGIVIIVIQGILTIALLIAITIGAISSYMSLTRNHEGFHPRRWRGIRRRYFKHVEQAARDRPPSPPPPPPMLPEIPSEPYFKVGSVTRQMKIEDEDERLHEEQLYAHCSNSMVSRSPLQQIGTPRATSRAQSVRSTTSYSNLPYGARPHRASWSSRDFDDLLGTPDRHLSGESLQESIMRQRASTMRSTIPPRLDMSPNQIRASSLRGLRPSNSDFQQMDSPNAGSSRGHRRTRSGSAVNYLNQHHNIDEEDMEIQEIPPLPSPLQPQRAESEPTKSEP